MNLTLKTGEVSPAELLDLCKSINELTVTCGTALHLRALVLEQQANAPTQMDGESVETVETIMLEKLSRKLNAIEVTLAESSAVLSTLIGSIVGVPPRPDTRR